MWAGVEEEGLKVHLEGQTRSETGNFDMELIIHLIRSLKFSKYMRTVKLC